MGYAEARNRGHTKLVIPCLRLCPITYVENIEQCLSIIGIHHDPGAMNSSLNVKERKRER
jgi:hypothetical protein